MRCLVNDFFNLGGAAIERHGRESFNGPVHAWSHAYTRYDVAWMCSVQSSSSPAEERIVIWRALHLSITLAG